MPIDVDRARGADLPVSSFSWTDEDVILYNLGIGAGDPPTEPRELRYAYEVGLVVIPTFGTIPPFGIMMSMTAVEGLDIDLAQILHGEQELILHDEIPSSGTVTQTGRVVDVFDKARGALVVIEIVSVVERTGEKLFTNRSSIYVRGEGGFGGDKGPRTDNAIPDREPDHVATSATLPQQALLYRMSSGDKNPLHADPAFAALAGYERPILHGLCTYGIVAKAVLDEAMGGDPARFGGYRARFSGHVFPGETLVTSIWDEGGHLVVAADVAERGTRVLSNGRVALRPTGSRLTA